MHHHSVSKRVALLALLTLVASPTWARAQAPARVLPLGDSITESFAGWHSYRYWLWKDLAAGGTCVDFVGSQVGVFNGPPAATDFDQDHEGHVGWKADEIAAMAGPWAAAAGADVALLHVGTNDLWSGESVASTLADIDQIVDALRAARPGISICLAQLIPADPSLGFDVGPLNAALAAYVPTKDAPSERVVLVDQATLFDPALDTFDGVHPNTAGEQKIAVRFLTALTPLLPNPGTCEPAEVLCLAATACPCNNPDPLAGCANSTGFGARLSSSGSASISVDNLVLRVDHLPPATIGLFLSGTASVSPLPFADGLRCVGGTLRRFPPHPSGPTGQFQEGPGIAVWADAHFPGALTAGTTWTFQAWYRDLNGPCGKGSNLSSAGRVSFVP